MATVIWVAVFFVLMVELAITLLLVLPLPRFVRKFIARKIFTYDLGKRVRFFSNFIIFGLILAVSDAVQTLRHLDQKQEVSEGTKQHHGQETFIGVSLDKQRKFRAERNVSTSIIFQLPMSFKYLTVSYSPPILPTKSFNRVCQV